MIRVTFSDEELNEFPTGREGDNCKLFLPEPDVIREQFAKPFIEGPPLAKRTYTVRHFLRLSQECVFPFT